MDGVKIVQLKPPLELGARSSQDEIGGDIPFKFRRFSVVKGPEYESFPVDTDRLFSCVRGSVTVALENQENKQDFVLSSPLTGLHVPPGPTAHLHGFSADAIVLVFLGA